MDAGCILEKAGYKSGGALSTKERDRLPDSAFALPGRRYPVNDEDHARAALSMVAAHGTEAEKARVRGVVRRRYPGIEQSA